MKLKTTLASILVIGLATASAIAQRAPGDLIGSASSAKRAQIDPALLAPVRLVSVVDASGKPTVVLASGQKLSGDLAQQKTITRLARSGFSPALAKAKAARSVSVGTSVSTEATPVITPGQTVFLGTTGGTTPNLGGPIGTGLDTVVVSAPAAGGSSTLSANPLAASIERQVFVGDLTRDTSTAARGLTLGTSAPTTGTLEIGPNGFPVPTGTAAPQAGTLPIGPNGFPGLTTTGPQSGIQPIDPNGFPAMNVAPLAQTGLTRAGAARDTTVPATGTPAPASRAISISGGVPVLTAPAGATTGATAAPAASPR
jgi:hypothetical protein